MRASPLNVFVHGYFWVVVFFILSGFVLPLRYFATIKDSCIYGGTFRRYLRLMIPAAVAISIYYWVVKMGFTQPKSFRSLKRKNFLHLIFDGLFGIWFGDTSYCIATWTLSIELFATFFVYLLAYTAINYRNRFYIYLLVCVFVFIV